MIVVYAAGLFVIIAARYFLVAGSVYLYFWRWKSEAWRARRIRKDSPLPKSHRLEIRYSILSSIVFAVLGAVIFAAWNDGHTCLYSDVSRYGWGYFLVSIPLLLLLHDTYFYWTHRWMHSRRLFSLFHRVHHASRIPSPWAAFSFHPWEAIVEAAIFPLLAFTVPIHMAAFFTFLGVMTVLSVVNHLGFETYPRGFATHPIGKWIISATHHDLHHRYLRCNYGLYFSLWDRWMGTEDSRYPQLYAEVTASPQHVVDSSAC